MNRLYEMLSKIERMVRTLVLLITCTCMVLITCIIFIQVICRYFLQNSLSWSEELTRYLMVWLVFTGAGYVLGIGAHSNMDILISRLPERVQFIISKFNAVLLIFFSAVVTRYGFSMVSVGAYQKSSALHLPMHLVYFSIPLGGMILLFYSIMLLLERKKGGEI